jgi:hypothetical protein
VEHHRTLGDRVRDIVSAGLVLDDLVEPEWPEDDDTCGVDADGVNSPADPPVRDRSPARAGDGAPSRRFS